MSKAIKAIHYDEQAVGRRIKSSKKRYTWKFSLDDEPFTVELFSSKFSGKKSMRINGEKCFEGKKEGKVFHRSIEIKGHNLIIIEVGKQFDLKIDGISFKILQNQSSYDHKETITGTMSTQLIPESKAPWEKLARPYEITSREGLNVTTREKLPITRKVSSRLSSTENQVDMRYMFGTEAYSPQPRDVSPVIIPSKPRAFSSAHRPVDINQSNNLFF